MFVRGVSVCALLVLAGCGEQASEDPVVPATGDAQIVDLVSPAAPGSAEPQLSTHQDGTVYLSWLEPQTDGAHGLRFSRLMQGATQWSAPQTVVQRKDLFVNWADFPSLLPARDGRLVAHWLQKNGTDTYAYEVRVAQSLDGGGSWSEPRVLHDDGVAAEHGFVSLWETPQGEVQAVWLDGRDATGTTPHPQTQLAFTTLSSDGVPGSTELIDARTCDCCQTDAALAAQGPVVAYRDRSEAEVRDIRVLRRVNGAWSTPVPVHADGWQIEGCPVNGPAIAAHGERVAVAWFTGAQSRERVSLAFSQDGGASFGAPLPVDEGKPLGRVDLVLDAEGNAVVSWLERAEGDSARVLLRRVHADGTRAPALEVARTAAARASGFPRMVPVGDELMLAWTDPTTPSRVRLARVKPGP